MPIPVALRAELVTTRAVGGPASRIPARRGRRPLFLGNQTIGPYCSAVCRTASPAVRAFSARTGPYSAAVSCAAARAARRPDEQPAARHGPHHHAFTVPAIDDRIWPLVARDPAETRSSVSILSRTRTRYGWRNRLTLVGPGARCGRRVDGTSRACVNGSATTYRPFDRTRSRTSSLGPGQPRAGVTSVPRPGSPSNRGPVHLDPSRYRQHRANAGSAARGRRPHA
jgi:hypothetical protein